MHRTLPLLVAFVACDSGALPVAPGDFEGDDPGECVDRTDNDRDGAFDCDDPGCAASPDCAPADTDDTEPPDDTDDAVDTEPPDDTDLEPPEGTVRESFPAAPEGPVDVVLVLDDSADMEEEQTRFRSAFPRLAEVVDARFDVRVGVLTTDVVATTAGRLRAIDGARWFELDSTSPPSSETLQDFLVVGTSGDSVERGLRAFRDAFVDAAPAVAGWNDGFLRDDAPTHVVFLGTEDDQSGSGPSASQFTTELAALKPLRTAQASAIVGPETGTCTLGRETFDAAPRYHEVVRLTGGVAGSLCEGFDPTLTAIGRQLVANLTTVRLTIPGTVVSVRVVRDGTVWRGQPDTDGPTCAPEPCFRWRQEGHVVRFLDGWTAPSGSTILVDVLPDP